MSEKDGLIYHRSGSAASLKEGSRILCRIDWDRRFDNMQRHCGEHILSGICYREFGGINRGFHMGEDYMTIDISLEEDPSITEITWEMAKRAELFANQVIWSDAPVTVRRFQTRQEAEQLPLRKALAIDEEISIVCVGDIRNAADCVACCGTHPSSAGQVGLVKIYKIEHYKGMFRIYFEAGKRALLDYDKKHDRITELGIHFSAGTDDLLDKVLAQEQRAKAVKDELNTLRQSAVASRVEEIRAALRNGDGIGGLPPVRRHEDWRSVQHWQGSYSRIERPTFDFGARGENPSALFRRGSRLRQSGKGKRLFLRRKGRRKPDLRKSCFFEASGSG